MSVTGPDFISLQVRNLADAATFYEEYLGLTRLPAPNPAAVVFATKPIAFALRTPLPGVDLDAVSQLGAGVSIWLLGSDVAQLHRRLSEAGSPIVQEPFEGPFGLTFSFLDSDGYTITIHDRA